MSRSFPTPSGSRAPGLRAGALLLAVLVTTLVACLDRTTPIADARVEAGKTPSAAPPSGSVHDTGSLSPQPAAPPAASLPETFAASIVRVDEAVRARMGTSWRPGCPVGLEDLRVIEMTHWTFEGTVLRGELMVHRRYADDILGVFRRLFEAGFPIERMELANGYMGNDPPLAQFNNTVGFNCRARVGDSTAWSEHAYGRAVDINPDLNPYVSRSGRVEPPFGAPYVDRSRPVPGTIVRGDVVVRAFRSIGWRWGGDWSGTKDYMHFSATGY